MTLHEGGVENILKELKKLLVMKLMGKMSRCLTYYELIL